jgi:hypothetical protein
MLARLAAERPTVGQPGYAACRYTPEEGDIAGDVVPQPSLTASSRRSAEDFTVALCGLLTSLLTAGLLWWVETTWGFALYSLTLWFVIPAGALLSGFAGGSGYYVGSWLFGHRPSRLLLLNIVVASGATFFLIHYLSYITLVIEGRRVSEYLPFSRYLDIAIRSASMDFRLRSVKLASTGTLGGFGYVIALLQVFGFAAGGFAVYAYLVSQPYCAKCSSYLRRKGRHVRYTQDVEGLSAVTAQVLDNLGRGETVKALEQQKGFGSATQTSKDQLRSIFAIMRCRKCGQNWLKFSVEKRSGNQWSEISDFSVSGFIDTVVDA